MAWGVLFEKRRDRSVVFVFSIYNAGGSVCGCICLYTHTQTHCTYGVLDCESRGRDETPGGPEVSEENTGEVFVGLSRER